MAGEMCSGPTELPCKVPEATTASLCEVQQGGRPATAERDGETTGRRDQSARTEEIASAVGGGQSVRRQGGSWRAVARKRTKAGNKVEMQEAVSAHWPQQEVAGSLWVSRALGHFKIERSGKKRKNQGMRRHIQGDRKTSARAPGAERQEQEAYQRRRWDQVR